MNSYELAEALGCLYSLLLLFWSMHRVYPARRETGRRMFWLHASVWSALGALALVFYRLKMPYFGGAWGYLYLFLYWLIGMAYAISILKGWWAYKLAFVSTFVASHVQTHPLAITLSLALTGERRSVLFVVANHLFITLCAMFYRRYALNSSNRIPGYFCASSLLVSVLSVYCTLELMRMESVLSITALCVALGICFLAVSLVLSYYLYRTMTDYEAKLEALRLSQREEIGHLQFLEATQLYEVTSKMRHEFSNHLLVMDALMQSRQYDEMRSYFQSVSDNMERLQNSVRCGNSVVDALLSRKLMAAEERRIPFHIDAALPSHLALDCADLCSVLFNLIDNALEASEKLSRPEVWLRMRKNKNYICITVENAVDGDILRENPQMRTTKAEKERHGLGLAIVREIVEKYDGRFRVAIDGNRFVAQALLKDSPPLNSPAATSERTSPGTLRRSDG